MKNFLYFIMVIFLFLSSAGCASVGKDFESEKTYGKSCDYGATVSCLAYQWTTTSRKPEREK